MQIINEKFLLMGVPVISTYILAYLKILIDILQSPRNMSLRVNSRKGKFSEKISFYNSIVGERGFVRLVQK